MTQKEKAYDEALALMKDCIPDKDGYVCVRPCDIFSELKESKDEKIRKNCIHFLELQKKHHASTIEIDECIVWLEKQSNKPKKVSIWKHWEELTIMNNENWKNRKVDEEDARIMDQLKMLAEEWDTFEKAIAERIEYLFNAHFKVNGKEKDTAYQQLLQLFSIGYQCGWNDYKSIIDERKA